MKEKKSDICGIIGLCTGWLVPLAGIVLGIIALARKEQSKWAGITSIVVALLAWIFWSSILYY
jgi:hypothetical protein